MQGIAGLDCWIAQSGLQSNLVDWIVIDNPKLKLDLDCQSSFVISIQIQSIKIFFINKLKFHSASCSNNEAKPLFIKIFKQKILQ
jgi:hypothetical protein